MPRRWTVLRESLKSKDKSLDDLRDLVALSNEVHARDVADLKYQLDVAIGHIDALGVCSASMSSGNNPARMSHRRRGLRASSRVYSAAATRRSARASWSMKVVARQDNGLSEVQVLQQAQKFHEVLSDSQNTEASQEVLSEVLESFDKDTMAAFAAILYATGRDLGLYIPRGDIQLTVRVPPARICKATREELLKRKTL